MNVLCIYLQLVHTPTDHLFKVLYQLLTVCPCVAVYQTYPGSEYAVSRHPVLSEVVVVRAPRSPPPAPAGRPLVVDALCGAAVLRGADVYAPGVLACPPGEWHTSVPVTGDR